MKIPIDIHVRSERIYTDIAHKGNQMEIPDSDDFKVSGTMSRLKDGLRIVFTEGQGAVITTIDVFDDQTVSINREGEINSHMVFSKYEAVTCICNTGFFPLQMRISTKRLENSLSLDGGKLNIDYNVEIVGNLAEKNKLSFSVSPDISIIKN